MKNTTTAAAAALIAMSLSAVAVQAQSPATPTSQTDEIFLTQDAQGSVSDLATAEIGIEKASSPVVYQLANRVMKDHASLNMELYQFAHSRGLSLPVTMTSDDAAQTAQLMSLSGADFDRAYLQAEIKTNGDDVQTAQKELQATQDPDVRKLVQNYLKTEQSHLQMSQQAMATMTK